MIYRKDLLKLSRSEEKIMSTVGKNSTLLEKLPANAKRSDTVNQSKVAAPTSQNRTLLYIVIIIAWGVFNEVLDKIEKWYITATSYVTAICRENYCKYYTNLRTIVWRVTEGLICTLNKMNDIII